MFHTNISELFDLSEFSHKELFLDCVYPWHALEKLQKYIEEHSSGKIEGEVSAKAYLIHPESISIGKGSVVEPGAYIKGPCIIGEHCTIRHGAYLRGNILTGDRCVIGHDTEVKSAIFLNQAQAAHFAYVGDSILGCSTNLGAGCKCANLRLDRRNISVRFHDEKIKTGLKKFGVILGDGSQIGCNCVLGPGAIIGRGVKSHPCLHLRGTIPNHSMVKPCASFLVESILD